MTDALPDEPSDASPDESPDRFQSLDALLERVLGGDEPAWTRFFAAVYPTALAICRRRRFGHRRWDWRDAQHDVALLAVSRLREHDFAALRRYVATRHRYPAASFDTWLATIVSHAHIDHLRRQPEIQRERTPGGRKLVELQRVSLDQIDGDPSRGSPVAGDTGCDATSMETRVEVRRILARVLDPGFPADQRRALLFWLQGASAAEIAEDLDLADVRSAHRLLRAARQRLRRAYPIR